MFESSLFLWAFSGKLSEPGYVFTEDNTKSDICEITMFFKELTREAREPFNLIYALHPQSLYHIRQRYLWPLEVNAFYTVVLE